MRWDSYCDTIYFKEPLAKIRLRPQMRVLDIGCGYGEAVRFLRDKGIDAIGLDLPNNPNCNVIGDAHLLPFKHQCFDLILCINVFEHLSRPNKALSEVMRLLKNGGILLLVIPNKLSYTLLGIRRRCCTARSVWFGKDLRYYTMVTKWKLTNMLENHGLKICSIYTAKYFPDFLIRLFGASTEKFIDLVYTIERAFRPYRIPILGELGISIICIAKKIDGKL